ncbi:MAG: class I SAM-dependent methyltransferase, partial [Caldilineaceae bacterium]
VGDLAGSVLEIGVGAGENLRYYRRADVIHAIEPNAERARQAEDVAAVAAHGIPIHVRVAPAEALPFPDAMFDVVVSSLVFCSVTDQARALGEIERVLRPDGVLWMVEHVRPKTPILAQVAAAVTPYWRRIAHNCHLDRPTLTILAQRGWRVDVLRRRGVFVKLRATR